MSASHPFPDIQSMWGDERGNAPNRADFALAKSGGLRLANFLFADGHCEGLPLSVLPLQHLAEAARASQINDVANGVNNLKPWPHPHWRVDQR